MKNSLRGDDSFFVKKSTIEGAGLGCFARNKYRVGDTLGEFKGEINPAKSENSFTWDLQGIVVDASKAFKNNPMRYVNGCNKEEDFYRENVKAIRLGDAVFYKAIHNIKAGDELIVDYGTYFFKSRNIKVRRPSKSEIRKNRSKTLKKFRKK